MESIPVKVKGIKGHAFEKGVAYEFTGKVVAFADDAQIAVVIRDDSGKFVRCSLDTLTALK